MKTKIIATLFLAGALFVGCQNQQKPEVTDVKQQEQTTAMAQTAKNTIDWVGTYTGTLPCADCPGIKTQIILNSDGTFEKTSEYLEKKIKPETVKGSIVWSEDGMRVKFDGYEYLVEQNQITQLDTDGKVITGATAPKYVLTKAAK